MGNETEVNSVSIDSNLGEAIKDVKKIDMPRYQQDEGWAWVVLIGATTTMFLGNLPFMSFGILYAPILEDFNVSSSQIAWINGSLSFIWNCAILFVGPLCDEFGWKNVGMCAAVINASGIFLSAWVPTPSVLYLYISILGGIGGTTIISLCLFVVPHYFVKRREPALAINSLGTCVALMVGPQFVLFLRNQYGTTWAFLILGTFLLNGIPSTWVFHPLDWHPKTIKTDPQLENVHNDVPNKSETVPKLKVIKPPLSTKLLTVVTETFRSFHLLKQRKVVHICMSKCCIYLGFITFQMWIPFAVVDRGYSLESASICMSVAGFGNVLGRFCIAIIAHCYWFHALTLFKISLFLTSVSIFTFAQASSLVLLGTSAALWGFSIGLVMSLYYMCIIQVVGLKAFPMTFGLASLFAGTFLCIIGPVIGAVKDLSETFALALSIIGVMVALSFVLWVTMPMSKSNDKEKANVVRQESV